MRNSEKFRTIQEKKTWIKPIMNQPLSFEVKTIRVVLKLSVEIWSFCFVHGL